MISHCISFYWADAYNGWDRRRGFICQTGSQNLVKELNDSFKSVPRVNYRTWGEKKISEFLI